MLIKSRFVLMIVIISLVAFLCNFAIADVIPTPEWVNFYSDSTTLDGQPIPVGSVIKAYDPDTVLCGIDTVETEGQYGFLLVYKDDFTTDDIDEGADPGDTITFYINGHLAIPKGHDAHVWTSSGDIIQVNLEGHSNYDPEFTSTADTTATEDVIYSYAVTATDIDNDTLTYSFVIQPSWLSINSETGTINGTPTNDDVGDTTVSIKVEDGNGGEDTQTYTLYVNNVNDPPIITTTSLSDAVEDVAYSDSIEVNEIDIGDVLTFSLLIHPSWLSINNSTGKLLGTPSNDDVGTGIQVKVMVSDSSDASNTLDTFIDVINTNDAPVISNLPDSIIFRADTTHTINLNNYVEDVDDPNSTLDWSVSGNDSVSVSINASTNIAEFSASLTYSGRDTILFTVKDDSLDSDSETIIVIVIPYIYSESISLNSNWNLISWGVDHSNDSLEALLENYLDDFIVVMGFENEGLIYNPGLPQFSNLILMDHLHGYWIKSQISTTINITGATVPDTTNIFLEKGWNLVSYLPEASDSITHALESIFENVIVVMGYNGGGLSCYPPYLDYSNLYIMSHNYGYWIKLQEKDTLIYPEEQIASTNAMAKASSYLVNNSKVNPTNEWMNIFSENITINSMPLKVGSIIEAKDPDGVVCGEFVVKKAGQFGMMPVYRDDPRSEIDEGAEPGDVISIFINNFEVEEKVIWKNFGDVEQISIELTQNIMPKSYNLDQNYPNPFNPTTNIQFQLPKTNHIVLKIYNTLGENIKTLVDKRLQSGYHSASWNGRNNRGKEVSSGIYFYQIKAGKFTETKKMIYLR